MCGVLAAVAYDSPINVEGDASLITGLNPCQVNSRREFAGANRKVNALKSEESAVRIHAIGISSLIQRW